MKGGKKMNSRPVDIKELEKLSSVGGSDINEFEAQPYVLTAVACSVIATITVVSLIASQVASCKEVC